MRKTSVMAVLGLLFCGQAQAQTAPETLAYLLFGISTSQNNNFDTRRIDFPQSTPTVFQFVRNHLGKNKEVVGKDNDVKIEQVSPCNFQITGQYRWGNNIAFLDNTLDFTNVSGTDPQVVSQTIGRNPGPDYYLRIEGVRACSRQGSFRDENRYYQFPDKGQCENQIFSASLFNDDGFRRTQMAYKYFKQTYCKGRAF